MKKESVHIKLSFIVPVYNMEKYLVDCVNSIFLQKVQESEIILIDDGSTDSSPQICDSFAAKYSNIKVVHKANEGISSARNVGLEIAVGDYVCFFDSDDFYKEVFAKEFLQICYEHNLDIIRGWYGIYDEELKKYLHHECPNITYMNQVMSGVEFLVKSVNEHANEVVPWLGFFKREYLLKNGLRFPEGIVYEEDQLFFLETLVCDKNCKAYQSDLEFYAYRKRNGSATKTPTVKQIEDILYVVERENALLKKYALIGAQKEAALKYICSSFYQLTSIYGRLVKKDKKRVAQITPFSMKWQCICHSYDRHQRLKIILFTFARWLVDMIYERKLV